MATQFLHDDIRRFGLMEVLDSDNWHGSMLLVICAGTPDNRLDAMTDYPGGKRLTEPVTMSEGDFTEQARVAGGLEVLVSGKDCTTTVAYSGDLTNVLVDDDRVLVVEDCEDQEFPGADYVQPVSSWAFGFGLP